MFAFCSIADSTHAPGGGRGDAAPMKRLRVRRRGRRAATMIEFALTVPIYILILFGTFDLGWMA